MFFSVDTDVFVLLVGHYPHIPKSVTVIRTKREKICIGKSYNKLGPKRADALIGWYAFKGTDNTGGFASKKEANHFKAFMQADDTILDAFAAYGPQQKFLIGYSVRWKDIYAFCIKLVVSVLIKSQT